MRSTRMILATAAASAALAIAAPGVYAAGGDWEQDDSSYSKEQDHGSKDDSSYSKEEDHGSKDDSSYSKEEDHGSKDDSSYSKEEEHGSKHDAPRGGMHTGGGALTAVTADDWGTSRDPKHDSEASKSEASKSETSEKDSEHGKDSSWSKDDEEKPRGGMHTGGGALNTIKADDWGTARDPKHDPETYKKDSEHGKDSSWSKDDEEKPRGGMHTGGGALDAPATTAGGLAVLAVAATGLYAARRKKSAAGLA
ncbi:hypothetical protein [Streptomyces sp. NPDC017202]|uniref:hypothetical protein n=1 Tax=Streptomyces sp. NPDC017202 TaxID=3364981 RepID=UPI0037AAD1A5